MNYLIVDDEPIILEGMAMTLRAVVGEDAVIYQAGDPFAAIEMVRTHHIDVMFSDVDMPGMNGLDMVRRIQEISEDTDIVFATGYAHYSLDAWQTAAQAFILKPVGEDEMREVLAKLMRRREKRAERTGKAEESVHVAGTAQKEPEKDITAMCFGNFEIFYKGRPIHFTRKKSKEMLAYLIDRRGAMITTDQIRSILWDEDADTEEKQGYVRVLANDIRKAFGNIGVESILINDQNSYCVDTARISCDYYDFLDGDEHARRNFQEEYMMQYSWAEATLGRLLNML